MSPVDLAAFVSFAAALGLPPQRVAAALDDLAAAGFVRRTRDGRIVMTMPRGAR